jgi:NAD(P)H-nitrite reductase large subunit
LQDRRRYVIIGNGIAGTGCAETLRKNDPDCSITLFSEEPYPLYNRVSLPPFLKLQAQESKVLMRNRERHEQNRIDLRLETRVTAVCPQERTVTTQAGEEVPYDALLIATGGSPNRIPVPGGDLCGIYNFQTLDDSKAINARILESKTAVTTGGSYIAYELTEAFRARGLETTWIMRGPRFLRRTLDAEGGRIVDAIAADHGVRVIHGEEIAEVYGKDGVITAVETSGGQVIEADMLGVGLGLTLNTGFLKDTGLELRGGIVTDEKLRTNLPDIYAAGDVAIFYDTFIDAHSQMGTWDNSSSQGRLVARNMAGADETYVEVPTYTSTMFHSKLRVVGITSEVSPEVESITKADHDARTYARLFFLHDRLVGAVAIGELRNRKELLTLIKTKAPLVTPSERQAVLDAC